MRLFTAIPLPEEKKQLAGELMRGKLPVPYVNTTNLHITLNFFGELDTDGMEKVRKLFPEVVVGRSPFEIEFDAIVKFRHQLHMTVKPSSALNQLQKEMEARFEENGYRFADRDYYPHVTLANLHMDNVMNKHRKTENFPNEELINLNFLAEKIVLFESKLLLHHPHHIPIMEEDFV